jgi:glycosyltransferase involved in cell wall biosynthesis
LRTVLFFRHYTKFTGGHLKVWNYFNHVLASPQFTPRVWFSEASTLECNNPWQATPDLVVSRNEPIRPDVFVVAGVTWKLLDRYPYADPTIPVINLVQHVRHAAPELRLRKFLRRKAIRICVSEEVAEAVRATGTVVGPIVVIPNGIDLEDLPEQNDNEPKVDVLVAALKEPELGSQVADRLAMRGRSIKVLSERIPRQTFLSHIQNARTTVFLPHETEGFFLPALEGMALGTVVVCPDCVGNRSFCLPGHNAFRPNYVIDDVVRDAEAALALPADRARQLRENARRTADEHSLVRERQAFLDVLHHIDELWGGVDGADSNQTSGTSADRAEYARRGA